MSDRRPRLLILSFSEIANDARVKKQIDLFADRYRITTCGFGESICEGVEHIRLQNSEATFGHYLEAVLVRLHCYEAAHRWHPRARAASRALRGREFDVAIANDIDTIGVAFEAVGEVRTHADLHEFFPGLHDQLPAWVRIRKPFHEWAIRRFAARAGSVTTVSDTIAERYYEEFGINCGVVRNAAPYFQLKATPVGVPIRIVHSGGAQPNRRLEVMMEAVARSTADVTLDLYLTGEGSPYARDLRQLAEQLGERITVHPPVPQLDLVPLLNRYDVGIHILPLTNTNNALALPNKFFDYVQARLGLVIGPTLDMERLLNQFDLGTVAPGFEVDQIVDTLNGITIEKVEYWKRKAVLAAPHLCAEIEERHWEEAIDARLLARS